MAIDYDGVLDKFILVAREALSGQLSFIGQNSDIPAVIRVRQRGTKPAYPYVTLDVLDTIQETNWLATERLNSDGNVVYKTTEQLLLNYRVYGANAIKIANDLHAFFRSNRVLGDIRNTLGGSVVETLDIDQLPVLLADKYVESASFNIIFNIIDTYVDTTGYFNTITLNGEIKENESDTSPIDLNITVPTT